AAHLPDLPADGDDFEEFALVDQVPRVAARVPVQERLECARLHAVRLAESQHVFHRELRPLDPVELANPLSHGQLLHHFLRQKANTPGLYRKAAPVAQPLLAALLLKPLLRGRMTTV